MNIAVNTRLLIEDKMEGIGRFTFETAFRIANNNPSHSFYFFFDRPWSQDLIFPSNTKPVLLWPKARHPLLFIVWFEWSVRRALKKYKIDVFYSPDGFLSLMTDVPTLLTIHDIVNIHYPHFVPKTIARYYNYFVPKFLKKASSIIAVSGFVKKDLLAHFPFLKAEKIEVAYNALPSGRTFEINKKVGRTLPERPYFLCISSIHPRKNIDTLLKAFSLYQSKYGREEQLIIIGRNYWKLEKSFNDLFQRMIQQNTLIHLPNIKDSEMGMYLKNARALVYISLYEGFGIPILEGMANDLPVITSNSTSMPEVAADAALIVDPLDVDAIADALHRVATDESLRQSLISKGKKRVLDFSWDNSAKIIFDRINSLGRK